jgi:hypothetical protein
MAAVDPSNDAYMQLWLDRKRTGMIKPNVKLDNDLTGQKQLSQLMADFRTRSSIETGMLGRNQHVSQCRFGGAGNVSVDTAGNVCGFGLTPPQEISGLIGMDKLTQNDFITFNMSLVVPVTEKVDLRQRKRKHGDTKELDGTKVTGIGIGTDEKTEFSKYETQFDLLDDQADQFYFIEGQIDGVIKKTYPSADVLSGEGVLYEVVPVASRLSKETKEDWSQNKDTTQQQARDKVRQTFGNLQTFEKHITNQYIPLKIGRIPLRYWVAVYNDMKTAQAILTSQYVDYEKLKEGLFAGTSSGIVSLASYPVTEVTHQKGRRIPQSSLVEPASSQPRVRPIVDDVVQPPTQRRRRSVRPSFTTL